MENYFSLEPLDCSGWLDNYIALILVEESEVPRRHLTDKQVKSYLKYRNSTTTEIAAAKAGFSRSTGYRINKDPRLPSQKKTLRGRRKPDPLGGLFETDVVPLLKANPAIRPVTHFKELLRRHPHLNPGIRRTLERRIRAWRQ